MVTHRDLDLPEGVQAFSGDVRELHAAMTEAAGGTDLWIIGGGDLAGQFADAGIDAVIPRVSTLVGLHLGATAPRTYDDAKTTDVDRYGRFFHAMLRRGVAMAPGAYEVLFPGLAHTDEVIDEIVSRAADAAAEVADR